MTLKELVGKIKINEEWHKEYKNYVPQFIENAKKNLQWKKWEKAVFEEFFEKSNGQCVASITQKYYNKKEQENIKTNWNKIAPLLKEVAENQYTPKWDTYVKIYEEIFKLTEDKKKAATNRLIASLQPNLLCASVTNKDLKRTFDLLSIYELEGVPTYSRYKDENEEWFRNSNKLINYIKTNLSTNSGYDICTLPWEIKEYLEKLDKKKNVITKRKDIMDSKNEDPQKEINSKEPYTHPLNLILYGPPGTGKTYNTVNEALSIIEGKKIEDLQKEAREDVLERFNQYKEEGRIVFTTFHQSLSYEEFIEGIKPIPGKNDVVATHNNATNPTPGATQFGEGTTTFENLKIMQYKPQDGIFKELCDEALKNPTKVVTSLVIKKTPVVPSTLTIDQLLNKFTKEVKAKGKIVITIDDAEWEITKEKSFRVKKANRAQDFPVTDKTIKRDWDNFKNGEIESANDIKPTQNSKSDSLGTREEHWVLYNALRDFENELLQKEQNIVAQDVETTETITENAPQNYVLIIDEINRGNVSQIFGELITLIEEDKRTTKWDKDKNQYVDNPEKITVKLPYSPDEKPFGVPGNLYIIGTMNTADRSVEALDTALRRRFDFKEMMPKPNLLDEPSCKAECAEDLKNLLNNTKTSLAKILTTINERIRVLKDREHQIGHSYFMKCKTEEDLKNVFKNNIVPLLQEYFYGNYAYIGLVLGNEFVQKDEEANNPKFATFDGKDSFENNTDTQYKLLDEEGWRKLKMKDALQQLIG